MKKEIEFLKWDSDFFSKKIGKIHIVNDEQFCDKDIFSYDLVYVFSESPNLKYPLVDEKVIYGVDLKFATSDYVDMEFYDSKIDSYEDLLLLTLQSGEYSRFKKDINFGKNGYEKLYKEWIDQSINKILATDIIIKRLEGKISGFVTLNKKSEDVAEIGLVAVDPNFRGKGIAKELIFKTLSLAKKQGYSRLYVATQLDNKPATNLYMTCGFTQFSLTYIYHIWNYDTI